MFNFLGRLTTQRPRRVLLCGAVLLAAAGILGGGVADRLIAGGFEDPDAESQTASALLDEQFGAGTPDVVLVVTPTDGTVDDPEVAEAGRDVTEQLAATADVDNVVSYWSAGNAPPLRSEDGGRALVLGRIDVEDEDTRIERVGEIGDELADTGPAVDVAVGGPAETFREINTTIEDDLVLAEVLALPLTLLLLVLIFGGFVAAGLPVAVGMLSILSTFLVLRLLSEVTDVSIYALNLTTALGLGLAIDYSLFVVSRFREELRAGHEPDEATRRTIRTAGRTVAFSALTVAASLCALLIFPFAFLRSMAFAGAAVAILCGLLAVTVLPAVLRLLGHRVNALTVRQRSVAAGGQFWYRAATMVMKRPVPVALTVVVLLLLLLTPFTRVNLTLPDDRVLPESASSRQVGDILRDELSSQDSGALSVVLPDLDPGADAGNADALDTYATELARLDDVARVDAAGGTYCGPGLGEELGCQPGDLVVPADSDDTGRFDDLVAEGGTHLTVVPAVEPLSSEGEDLVHAVRDLPAPATDVAVGGPGAELVDTNDSLYDRLPMALALIAVITFVLLFLMFGSVVIPLKAIVLNLLSLSAMFGAMVWIFQDGNLSGLLDFTATGGLNSAMPVLMFCIAFGLSMDYEVFLLSRIKEEHDAGADDVQAVARGLQRTGRIVTAAATLMAVIFVAFAVTANVSFMMLFGVGLTLAVLLDAFVIRGTLVPAFMRLAGDWNWWAPGPLRRVHDRWGISESDPATAGRETGVTVSHTGGPLDEDPADDHDPRQSPPPTDDRHQPVS